MTRVDEVRERLDTFEEYDPALGGFRAGVYRLGKRTVAVNRPTSENLPERVDEDALKEILADQPKPTGPPIKAGTDSPKPSSAS